MTRTEWQAECNYISRVTQLGGLVSEMQHDKKTFISYCEMQRSNALRDGQKDAADFIAACIRDLNK